MTSSSTLEATQSNGCIVTQTVQQPTHKIARMWEGFSREKRSPKTHCSSASPSLSQNPSSTFSMIPTKVQPRSEYCQGSKGSDRESAWPRRKGSFPDLSLKAMTTVQEYPMDSRKDLGRETCTLVQADVHSNYSGSSSVIAELATTARAQQPANAGALRGKKSYPSSDDRPPICDKSGGEWRMEG